MRIYGMALVAAFSAAACTGANGKDGTNGTNGTDGMNGMNGMDGTTYILSETAKHGLDIAPVTLNLAGLDGPGIEKVGQGSYLVNAVIDCSGCHGEANAGPPGYLAGGVQFPFDAAGDYVYTRNLTPDPTTGLTLTEAQFLEVMHTGRDFKNNGGNGLLIVMPWSNFRWMADEDLKAIYAYLKVIPPVSNQVMADSKGQANVLTPIPMPTEYDVGDQIRPLPPATDAAGNPTPDPTRVLRGLAINPLADPPTFDNLSAEQQAEFGRGSYIVNAAPCNDCHTNPPYGTTPGPNFLHINTAQYLTGGAVFTVPPPLQPILMTTRSMSANLIGQQRGFLNQGAVDFPIFEETIVTGTHADDPNPAPLAWPMPWQHFQNLTEYDLVSLYVYLNITAGTEGPTGNNDKHTQMAAMYCDASHTCPSPFTTCNMNATFGNECVGNSCQSDDDCGACQHCDNSNHCAAPDPANQADQVCVGLGR